MSKNTKIVVIILLVIAIGVLSFYYFNTKDQIDICCDVESDNGDDGISDNGEETEPETGNDNLQEINLEDSYLFTIQDPRIVVNGYAEIKINPVSDKVYDYEIHLNSFASNEDEFNQKKSSNIMILNKYPDFFTLSLNEDFARYTYEKDLVSNGYFTFEEVWAIFREEEFKLVNQSNLISFNGVDDLHYFFLIESMLDQNIKFRNVTFSLKTTFEGEIYPDGFFIFNGDEKKVFFETCNLDKECSSIFGDEEWIDLDDYLFASNYLDDSSTDSFN